MPTVADDTYSKEEYEEEADDTGSMEDDADAGAQEFPGKVSISSVSVAV